MLIASVLVCVLTVFVCSAEEQKDSLRLVNLQEVEVSSVRAKDVSPLSYSNVNKETIEKENFGKDIPFLLTITPSLVTTSDAGTGIGYTSFRIRGTDANRINITANGIPLNDAESHGVFWVNMPDFASSVQDLQVQRGVGTSTNGAGAFGASINLKTGNIPSDPYGELNGSYGSFNTYKATLKLGTGQIGDHWAFDARLSKIASDGYIDRASVDLQSYFAQAGYFNDNTLLKLVVFGGKEQTYHAWYGVPKDSLSTNRRYNPCGWMGMDGKGKEIYYDKQTDNYVQKNFQLSLLQVLHAHMNLNVALHYTKGDGYYEEYKPISDLASYLLKPYEWEGETVASADLIQQKHLDNTFGGMVFSLNYQREKWDVSLGGGANYYDGHHFGRVMWTKQYAGDAGFMPEHEFYRSKGEKADANIYLKANYALSQHINLYGDLQYRHIDYRIKGQNDLYDAVAQSMQLLDIHKKYDFFNPKAGIFYRINKSHDLFASFAVGHREPNRNNFTRTDEGKIPSPETLYDYELGYKFRHAGLSAGVNVYYMQYKDQLVLTGKVNEIGEALSENVKDSYRTGIELTLGAKLSSWLEWGGNLTLSENKIKHYTDYYDDWDNGGRVEEYMGTTTISFSPKIVAGSLFSFSLKNWDAALQSNYVGKQYLDNTGSDERALSAYFVNNLRLGYTFRPQGIKSVQVSLLVNNLFDEQYESNAWVYSYREEGIRKADSGYFTQAGIHVLGNVAVKF